MEPHDCPVAFVSGSLFGCLCVRSVSKTRRCLPNPSLSLLLTSDDTQKQTQTKGGRGGTAPEKVKDCFVFRSLSKRENCSKKSAERSLPGAPRPRFEQIRVSPKGKSRLSLVGVRAAQVRFGGSPPTFRRTTVRVFRQWLRTGPLLYTKITVNISVCLDDVSVRARGRKRKQNWVVIIFPHGGTRDKKRGVWEVGDQQGKGIRIGETFLLHHDDEGKAQKFRVQYW